MHVRDLVITTRSGRLLIGPTSFDAHEDSLTLLAGADPAARWALGTALAGVLPERLTLAGRIEVAGRHTPPLLRTVAALAQSWRIRGVARTVDRRLAALSWAASLTVPLIVLSPGLDGLAAEECQRVLEAAQRIAATGRTLLVTAPVTAEALAAAAGIATIELPPRF